MDRNIGKYIREYERRFSKVGFGSDDANNVREYSGGDVALTALNCLAYAYVLGYHDGQKDTETKAVF